MSGGHARLPPSSAEQWGNCPGSVKAQAPYPDLETEESREGTAAHWVASSVLEGFRGGDYVTCAQLEGTQAPNGVVIDEKMVEGAQIFVDDVIETYERFSEGKSLLIEHRVHMPEIHPTDNWGTLDSNLYVPARAVLFLWDYKHGHRECDVVENLQMVDYLNGLVNLYQIDGRLEQSTTVVVRIVQPFCYSASGPIREWVVRLSDLRALWNKLRMAAAEALGPSPRLTSGKWCRDCKAVLSCSAARLAGYNLVDAVKRPYVMDNMTGADLAVERGILKDGVAVAKARLEAIEDELGHRIRRGETDSGLTLEQSKGREVWNIPTAQVVALVGQLGVDAHKDAVLTPTQTRAAAPREIKGMLSDVISTVTRRPPGKLKLTQAENTKSARAFQKRN